MGHRQSECSFQGLFSRKFIGELFNRIPKGMAGLEWYEAKSVQYHLRDYSQTRPIIMAYSQGAKKFFRPILFATTDVAVKWLRYFGFPKAYPHIYQSCLTFDYSKIPSLPPALPNAAMVAPPRRSAEQHRIYSEYMDAFKKWKDEVWNENLDEVGFCTGRDLVYDIDEVYEGVSTLGCAAKLARHLRDEYGVEFVEIDFSGSKGFHLVVPWPEADKVLKLGVEGLTPLNRAAKRTWGIVKKTFRDATGFEFREADLSPMRRQGIRRCPHSVHPKTNRVMTPLSRRHILNNRGEIIFDQDRFHYKRMTFPKTPFNYTIPNALEWVDDYLEAENVLKQAS